jgi:hypothetical protein
MGIFRSIFGDKKSQEEAASTPEAKLAEDLYKRAKNMNWGWDQPQARALAHEILNHAAPRFDNAKVKEIPDDKHIDLRGRYDGAPVRFAVWMTFGSFWAIEMLCKSRRHGFKIERDHEKIPSVQDADDPFAQKETRRIFIAKGIFFEDSFGRMEKSLDIWEDMPDEVQDRILEDMERLDISSIYIHEDSISLHQGPGFKKLPDGIGYMESCAQLMAVLKNLSPSTSKNGDTPTAQESTHHPGREFSCHYCHSIYWMTAIRTHCPNCGAPPSA